MATLEFRPPTEDELRSQTRADVFARGERYFQGGAVRDVALRGDTLCAEVEGSGSAAYQVKVTVGEDGCQATCSCPYMQAGPGEWCKHVVAALLVALRAPERLEAQPAPGALVERLTLAQLRALVAGWAERDPDAYDEVRAAAGRAAGEAPDPEALRESVRRRVSRALRDADPFADEADGSALARLETIAAEAERCLADGHPDAALAAAEALLEAWMEGWDPLLHFGALAAFLPRLARVAAEAVLTAPPAPPARRALEKKWAAWSDTLADYGVEALEIPLRALRLAARKSSGSPSEGEDAEAAPDRRWIADGVADARIAVLERAGRRGDALRLARAEGRHARAAALLLDLGRPGEAVEEAVAHLQGRGELLPLAQRLWAGGDTARALRLGEHALSLPAAPADAGLAAWLRDRAEEAGCDPLALRAATDHFETRPTVPAWTALRRLAGPRWPALRARMLARLREGLGAGAPGPVEVLLHEGLLAEALDAVESADAGLAARVADAAAEAHPERVIALARRHGERIMDAGHAAHYPEAAAWVARALRAYAALGRSGEGEAYLARLLARHRQKYRLRPLLEALRDEP